MQVQVRVAAGEERHEERGGEQACDASAHNRTTSASESNSETLVATIHVVPLFRAVTVAARMPISKTLATVVSRETKVATGVPVSGFVGAAVRGPISWFNAPKPSTH